MSELRSVGDLIKRLEDDDSKASRQLWDQYIQRLIRAARKRMKNLPRRAVDEEDVAISVFDAFIRGVKQHTYRRLENRDDLWQVLTMLAERKANSLLRRELAAKRGAGDNRGESAFEKWAVESSGLGGIDQVPDPAPAIVDEFTREVRERLDGLNDQLLRTIAVRKLEGCTNQEIAEQLGTSLRAIERKLNLIRQKWV